MNHKYWLWHVHCFPSSRSWTLPSTYVNEIKITQIAAGRKVNNTATLQETNETTQPTQLILNNDTQNKFTIHKTMEHQYTQGQICGSKSEWILILLLLLVSWPSLLLGLCFLLLACQQSSTFFGVMAICTTCCWDIPLPAVTLQTNQSLLLGNVFSFCFSHSNSWFIFLCWA